MVVQQDRIEIPGSMDAPWRVYNFGPGTINYGTPPLLNQGTIAPSAQLAFTSSTWIVSTSNSRVVAYEIPPVETDVTLSDGRTGFVLVRPYS